MDGFGQRWVNVRDHDFGTGLSQCERERFADAL
jgi:hypothetical protein